MQAPEPSVMAEWRCEKTVVNSLDRQGSEAGTAETWRVVLAWVYGDERRAAGVSIRVPNGVISRGLLMTICLCVGVEYFVDFVEDFGVTVAEVTFRRLRGVIGSTEFAAGL